MAIRCKGIVRLEDKTPDLQEFVHSLSALKEGEYAYYLCDKERNQALPQLKYLCGVVLKTISEYLPEHPSIDSLYRFFEKRYAPVKEAVLFGERLIYQDLKRCTYREMSDVIENIVNYASSLGVKIISREELKQPEAVTPYVDAYNNQWKDYSKSI